MKSILHTFELPGSAPVVVQYDPVRQWVESVSVGGIGMMLSDGCPLMWIRISAGQLPGVFWGVRFEIGPPAAWWFTTMAAEYCIPTLLEPWDNLIGGFERLRAREGLDGR